MQCKNAHCKTGEVLTMGDSTTKLCVHTPVVFSGAPASVVGSSPPWEPPKAAELAFATTPETPITCYSRTDTPGK